MALLALRNTIVNVALWPLRALRDRHRLEDISRSISRGGERLPVCFYLFNSLFSSLALNRVEGALFNLYPSSLPLDGSGNCHYISTSMGDLTYSADIANSHIPIELLDLPSVD